MAERKRAQILSTGIRLFSRYGARRVTVEELCREAGVSKATFYKYFPNKGALLDTIQRQWMDEGFAAFDEISSRDIPFPEMIAAMTQWKVEFSRRISLELLEEMGAIDKLKDEFKRRYLANVAAAQARGEVRADVHPELLWLVVEKLDEVFHERRWEAVIPDLGEYTRQIRALLWFGLLTRDQGGSP